MGDEVTQRLCLWPVPEPKNWISWVAQPQTEAELAAIRASVIRGCPFGSREWTDTVVRQLGLQATMRPRGRPRKQREGLVEL